MANIDSRLRVLLVSTLLAAYLLIYLNHPATIDGEATLAAADSLVKHGTPDIMVLGSAEGLLPPISRMGMFGADGLLYAKKGIVPSLLLLPLVALGISTRAAAMLFNPIITILTALTLYALARRMNYRPHTAFRSALLYGLGTLAIVYTRTLFGEPLAGLFLLTAVAFAHAHHQQPRRRALVIAGLMVGLACGVNFTYIFAAPILGLYALGLSPRRWQWRSVIALALPTGIIIVLLLGFNLLRFGSPLNSGYNFAAGEGFTSPFGLGVFGLLVSPYRGLFWYNPILLLILPGAWLLRRQSLTAVILALLGVQVVTYAAWWSWHGGIVWGPRFLLPVIPLLMLLTLPIIDKIGQQRIVTVGITILGMVSIVVQIPALLYDFVPYTMSLYTDYAAGVEAGFFTGLSDEVVYRLDLSPILGQFQVMLTGTQPAQLPGDGVHLAMIAVLVGIAVAIWRIAHKRLLWLVVPLWILAPLVVVARQPYDPAAAFIEANLLPADQIVVASTSYAANLMDVSSRTRIITTNAPTTPDDPLASGLWDYAQHNGGLTWFVTWFPPASADNWQERDLWQHAAFVREIPFNADRALLFDLAPTLPANLSGGWQFGPIELAAYGLEKSADGIRLTLDWTARATPAESYSWFVHLLDNSGQIVQQQDRQPQSGYAPTATWTPGDTISDYLLFPLSAATDTTGWQVRIGFVDPVTGERLPTLNPNGEPVPDGFILILV